MPSRPRRTAPVVVAAVLLAGAFLALPPAAAAQREWSAAFVPVGHWSLRAAHRVAALGLAPHGHDALRGVPTQREIGELLEHAVAATDPSSEAGRLARGYHAAYAAELGLRPGGIQSAVSGSSLAAGFDARNGAWRPGWGYEDGHFYGDWNDAQPLADKAAPLVAATLQLSPVEWAALRLSGRAGGIEDTISEAYAVATGGAIALWAGRRRVDWAPGPGDGLIVNDRAFDGAGFLTTSAFRLPGFLRHVGALHAEVLGARVDLTRTCHDPTIPGDAPRCRNAWFAATRGSVMPHGRVQLGVTRGVVFGGDGNTDIDAFALFSILIGKHAGEVSELDNQVVAVDGSWRLPTEAWLPLRAYLEWGFEDSAGAWMSVPGILAGLEVPRVPGAPGMSIALERTSFARSCCGNPIWYRSSVFHDGWVIDERPLGHRLGGHGVEWVVHLGWDASEPRVGVAAQLFTRQRRLENLYAEPLMGRSSGAEIRIDAAVLRGLEATGTVSFEDGSDWRATRAAIALRAFIRGR